MLIEVVWIAEQFETVFPVGPNLVGVWSCFNTFHYVALHQMRGLKLLGYPHSITFGHVTTTILSIISNAITLYETAHPSHFAWCF
jgi:hypothetical protein